MRLHRADVLHISAGHRLDGASASDSVEAVPLQRVERLVGGKGTAQER
jgi:hypothetical protein